MITSQPRRHWIALVLLLAFFASVRADGAHRPSDKDGTLVMLVTWGDIDNTPADDVYIEAHGFVSKYTIPRSLSFWRRCAPDSMKLHSRQKSMMYL
jgi:hypothetical protein